MVIVDMSTTRAQITKRQRRMRRAVHRRLQKQQKAQLRELRAAEAAREARQRAIARWNAEEDRLQRVRDNRNKPSACPELHSHASRAVKFAQNVMVTEIPVVDADRLPKPVTSPIGVSICGTDDSDEDIILSGNLPNAVPFSQLSQAEFPDDDEDPEFTPDESVKVNVRTTPIQRPRRRIIAKRLDIPLDQIIPEKHSTKSKHNSPPKRPRPETSPPSKPSPAPNGVEEDDSVQAKPSPEHGSPPKTRKSSKRKPISDTGSLPDGPKNKRRRVQSGDHESSRGKKLKAADDGEHNVKTVRANGVDQSPDTIGRNKKGAKTDRGEKPSPEAPSEPTGRVLLISTTKNADRKKGTSQQISSTQTKSKKREKPSASTAVRGSPQKKQKSNGTRATIPDSDQQDKPSESEDDQDLDNMFGNLVRMKAANRASHEKKAKLEKQLQNGEDSNLVSSQRAKSNSKKSPSRFTEDGLRIMTYDEIAADQPPGLNGECPFDCACCF